MNRYMRWIGKGSLGLVLGVVFVGFPATPVSGQRQNAGLRKESETGAN